MRNQWFDGERDWYPASFTQHGSPLPLRSHLALMAPIRFPNPLPEIADYLPLSLPKIAWDVHQLQELRSHCLILAPEPLCERFWVSDRNISVVIGQFGGHNTRLSQPHRSPTNTIPPPRGDFIPARFLAAGLGGDSSNEKGQEKEYDPSS